MHVCKHKSGCDTARLFKDNEMGQPVMPVCFSPLKCMFQCLMHNSLQRSEILKFQCFLTLTCLQEKFCIQIIPTKFFEQEGHANPKRKTRICQNDEKREVPPPARTSHDAETACSIIDVTAQYIRESRECGYGSHK